MIDLRVLARRELIARGFDPELPPPGDAKALQPDGARDLRSLLWSSIDNRESRDLDQVEVAEALPGGSVKVLVGIADVDALVPKGSPLDLHAALNTVTVYTGVTTFPMLPEVLSTDRSSLNQDQDRLSIVIEFVVAGDGSIVSSDVYRAVLRNKARLSYEDLADFLDGKAPAPAQVAAVAGLPENLKLQDAVARKLLTLRQQHGALQLETIEARTVAVDGKVTGVELSAKSRSKELIEDFMIAANGVMAQFLEQKGRSSIRRVVKEPERWDRLVELARGLGETLPAAPDGPALAAFLIKRRAAAPERFADLSLSVVKLLGPGEYDLKKAGVPSPGHFGLAVQDYTHSTAPNRRYADLITQRLVKAALTGAPSPYTDDELQAIAQRCTLKEGDARKVERFVRKAAAAILLQPRIGQTFDAIVTGATPKGVFVRLLSPPAEGRVMHGEKGLDVGAAVKVKLLAADPEKGFIDFERA
jgi:VacB/RNase II family 3'-5' exoribonuclease